MIEEKSKIRTIVDTSWSDYSDLDYWVGDMTRGHAQSIPKHVLKMAMKHLRDDMKKIHDLACELQDEEEAEQMQKGRDDV